MITKNQKLEINGTEIKPGQSRFITLQVARLYDYTEMKIPIQVFRGKDNGPRLFICAAIHGDEINGVEIIRRLVKHKALKNLKGTLITVPIVNVFGFNSRSRYLPDRRDLNRSFPGSEFGSLASQVAYTFMKEIVEKCTFGIDLHTGAIHRTNLPQIRADFSHSIVRKLAMQFGAPVVLSSTHVDGSLRQSATKKKIPMLLYEAGEALRFDEYSIKLGVQGILNTMTTLGMLEDHEIKSKTMRDRPFVAHASFWTRAPSSGVFLAHARLGDRVEKNEIIGTLSDPLERNVTEVVAKKTGLIIGKVQIPLVNRGDPLYHIATLQDKSKADEIREQLHQTEEDIDRNYI